jgi:O-acetyl-ADP-ribose deacetylase (regulator of RNase III)
MNTVLRTHTFPQGQNLQIAQGDITIEKVDAIVNAANQYLQHGGGLAWAISEKGGPTIQEESDAWIRRHGPISHTAPAWTSGGRLPAKYVIHAVGPVWGEGDEDRKLSEAVTASLQVADQLQCQTIAMPAISTGVFGFPKERAAPLILTAIRDYFQSSPSHIKLVRLVLFDRETLEAFLAAWQATIQADTP